MTTRGSFRDQSLRAVLANETVFPDALLDAWIEDAIRDYSGYVPNILAGLLTTTPGQREYFLDAFATPADVYEILAVEIPMDLYPPQFIQRLNRRDRRFTQGWYWDVAGPAVIELSWEPLAAEDFRVYYTGVHYLPEVDASQFSIPDGHLDVLKLYAIWMAVKKLEMDETAAPDEASLLLSMLGTNSARAERSYRAKMREIAAGAAQGGVVGPWRMDRFDGGY